MEGWESVSPGNRAPSSGAIVRASTGEPRRGRSGSIRCPSPSWDAARRSGDSDLQPTAEFDTEESQFGSRYEISYDTVVEGEESGTLEGSYRLPDRPWQVFLFEHGDVPEIQHSFGIWRSGITGIEFVVPRSTPINCDCITRAMSEIFGTDAWAVVRGPDSIYLK